MNTDKNVYFDIETAGYPADQQLKIFEPKMKRDGRIKDLGKIEADRLEKEQDWLAEAALDATRGVVLVVGLLVGDQMMVFEGEEKVILQRIWNLFTADSSTWVGHYIKGFDFPFAIRRSYVLGVPVPEGIFEGRYFSRRIVCTMETWCRGTTDKISLDTLARALGIGKKTGDGADFAELYMKDRDAALAYLKNDLLLAAGCAKIMGVK